MNDLRPPSRDNSSLWFILGGFLSVALVAFLTRFFSRQPALPITQPQPIQVEVQLPEQQPNQEIERFNWDVIGFASAAITLIGAAIFYFSGWSYASHWFGYYGINIYQLELSPPQLMVLGIPGIVYFVTILILIASTYGVISRIILIKYVPQHLAGILLVSFFLAFFILLVLVMYADSKQIPLFAPELWVLGVLSVALIYLAEVYDRSLGLFIRVNNIIEKPFWRRFFPSWTKRLQQRLSQQINLIQSIPNALILTWRIWIAFILLLLLTTGIAFSSVLGEFDAIRGTQSLHGQWQLVSTNVFSERPMEFLNEKLILENERGYEYGPFSLIIDTGQSIFLTDVKTSSLFLERPSLYIISRVDYASTDLMLVPSSLTGSRSE